MSIPTSLDGGARARITKVDWWSSALREGVDRWCLLDRANPPGGFEVPDRLAMTPASLPPGGDFDAPDLLAAKARRENFPVASHLLPVDARASLMAIYGFARLTDDLGDEAGGDRLALLDWLEQELELAAKGGCGPPCAGRAHARDPEPGSKPGAVPGPDRGEPDGPASEPLRRLRRPRRLLHVVRGTGRPTRAGRVQGLDTRPRGPFRQGVHRPAAGRAPPGRRRGCPPRPHLHACGRHGELRLRRGRSFGSLRVRRPCAASSRAKSRGRASCSEPGRRSRRRSPSAPERRWQASWQGASPLSTRSTGLATTCSRCAAVPASSASPPVPCRDSWRRA